MTTAAQMKEASRFFGGVSQSKSCVVAVEAEIADKIYKIPSISDYHSFEYSENRLTMWRYYGIGEGVSIPLDAQPHDLNETSYQVQEPFQETFHTVKRQPKVR